MDKNTQHKKREIPNWEPAFLAALAETGVVCRAADAAKVNRSMVYLNRRRCPEFAQRWDESLQDASHSLVDEAIRRAREGMKKYKFNRNGEPIPHPDKPNEKYFEHEYSDTLLIFLLKGLDPAKWGVSAKEIQQIQKDLAELKAMMSNAGSDTARDTSSQG